MWKFCMCDLWLRLKAISKQLPELRSFLIDVVPRRNEPLPGNPHRVDFRGGSIQTIFHRLNEGIDISGGHQPSILAIAYELRNSCNKGRDDWPIKRHRLHNNNRKTLGEARKNESACAKDLLLDLSATDPAGDADRRLELVMFDQGLNGRS